MAYPSIIGRMLDCPTINLGFSGNGKSEPEMAKLLAGLDPAVYILDSLPNLDVTEAAERIEPFVNTIRKAHPKTPVILIENVTYSNAAFVESRRAKVSAVNDILRKLYDKMKTAGDKNVYYVSDITICLAKTVKIRSMEHIPPISDFCVWRKPSRQSCARRCGWIK